MWIERDYKYKVSILNTQKSVISRSVYSCDLFDVLVLITVPYVGG